MAASAVEGRPIETRPPEKKDNTPAFPEQTRAPYHATAPFKVTTLIDGMHAPWSLALLPEETSSSPNDCPGTMRILDTKGALSAPLAGVSVVASPAAKDIGLLDVVLDPGFVSNHRIFFTFYDFIDGTNSNTCVARASLDEAKLGIDRRDGHLPRAAGDAVQAARRQDRWSHRHRARRQLVPDDWRPLRFAALGCVAENGHSPRQDSSHHAKRRAVARQSVSRQAGRIPEIWASGSRNGEGLAFDPKTGRLWETEHGPRGGDELNVIEKGKNYGWPIIVHGIDYPGTAIGEGITHKEGMEEPVYYWDPVIAPSGLAFYTGTLFPQWKDSVLVGGLNGMMLDRLTLANDKVVAEEPLLTDLRARIRDVRVGPDGAVYVLTDSGTPTVSPNTPPTSRLLKLTPK